MTSLMDDPVFGLSLFVGSATLMANAVANSTVVQAASGLATAVATYLLVRRESTAADALSGTTLSGACTVVVEENKLELKCNDKIVRNRVVEPTSEEGCKRLRDVYEALAPGAEPYSVEVYRTMGRAVTERIFRAVPKDTMRGQTPEERRWAYGSGSAANLIPLSEQLYIHFMAGVGMQLFPWGTQGCGLYMRRLYYDARSPTYDEIVRQIAHGARVVDRMMPGGTVRVAIDPSSPASWHQLSRYTKLQLLCNTRVDVPVGETFLYTIKVAGKAEGNKLAIAEMLREDEPSTVVIVSAGGVGSPGGRVAPSALVARVTERDLYNDYAVVRAALLDSTGGAWYSLSDQKRDALRTLWRAEDPDQVALAILRPSVSSTVAERFLSVDAVSQEGVARLSGIADTSEVARRVRESGRGLTASLWGMRRGQTEVHFEHGLTPRQIATMFRTRRIMAIPVRVREALRKFAGVQVEDSGTVDSSDPYASFEHLVITELREPLDRESLQPKSILLATQPRSTISAGIRDTARRNIPGMADISDARLNTLARNAWPRKGDTVDYIGPSNTDTTQYNILSDRSGIVVDRAGDRIEVEFILVVGILDARASAHLVRIRKTYDLTEVGPSGAELLGDLRMGSDRGAVDNPSYQNLFSIEGYAKRSGIVAGFTTTLPDNLPNTAQYILKYAKELRRNMAAELGDDLEMAVAPLGDTSGHTAMGVTRVTANTEAITKAAQVTIDTQWLPMTRLQDLVGQASGATMDAKWFNGPADIQVAADTQWQGLEFGVGNKKLPIGFRTSVFLSGVTGLASAAGAYMVPLSLAASAGVATVGLAGLGATARLLWDAANTPESKSYRIVQFGTTPSSFPRSQGA